MIPRRTWILTAATTLAILIAACGRAAAAVSAEGGLTLFGWSDQHVKTDGDGKHLLPAIDAMNALPGTKFPAEIGGSVAEPALVVGCGDITDWPTTAAKDTYEELVTRRLKFPSCSVVGNHDEGGKSPSETVKKWIIARHGGLSYTLDRGGVHLVVLFSKYDEGLNKPAQAVSAEALDFLRTDLAKVAESTPVVVAMHLCFDAITNREDLVQAFGDANVILVLAGHYHKAKVDRFRDVNFVQLPSPAPNGSHEVTVIRVTRDRLVAIPYHYETKAWSEGRGKVLDVAIRGPAAPAEGAAPRPDAGTAPLASPAKQTVFRSGADGYHTYRIPALVATAKGALLAVCEGRKTGSGDHGDIDLVAKRSGDGGKTWSPQQIVFEEGGTAKITIGNPCPVIDQPTGAIWLAFTRNNDRVFVTRTDDDGRTWAAPVDITATVKEPDWSWYATGPGHGIQLRQGPHKGRLVIPCDTRVGKGGEEAWNQKGHSLAIYSDDQGKTWKRGDLTAAAMNECEVVELADGSLLLSMRNYQGKNRRAFARSSDGGQTWSKPEHHEQVYCPTCQASIHRYSLEPENVILCSGPSKGRSNLTIRASRDEGRTWPITKVLGEGPSAYSDLAVLPDGTIGCLYETGKKSPYESIVLATFPLAWVKHFDEPGHLSGTVEAASPRPQSTGGQAAGGARREPVRLRARGRPEAPAA